MSLRKSPTLTPALLASNRRNAKKSTGPRTARGKARSRLNSFKHGTRSPEYIDFVKALFEAPAGRVAVTARALLASKPVVHPRLIEAAELSVETEISLCEESQRREAQRRLEKIILYKRSRKVIENRSRRKGILEMSRDVIGTK